MATWIAALAAVAGLIIAWRSARSARQSAESARRAAESSEQSAKTAKEAMELEKRPHLAVQLGHHTEPGSSIKYPEAAFIHNFGKGTAQNIKLTVAVAASGGPDRPQDVEPINREWGRGIRSLPRDGKELLALKGAFLRNCSIIAEYQDADGTPYGPVDINEVRNLPKPGALG